MDENVLLTVNLKDNQLATIDDAVFVSPADGKIIQKFEELRLDSNPLRELNEAAFGPMMEVVLLFRE